MTDRKNLSRLSAEALSRLATLRTAAEGIEALAALVAILDPDGRAGRWKTAGRIATLLQRFETTSWPRIRRGGREPRGPAEAAMAHIMAAGLPLSQRRLVDLLGN